MNDLISRQDAITEIRKDVKWLEEQGVTSMTTHERELRDTFILREMPSAQQWISCEKKLPEVEQPVRISVHGRVFDAVYKGLSSDQEPMWLSHGCVYWADEVSRWMPMPEPFEGGEK